MSVDRLQVRSAASPVGDAAARWRALSQLREGLVRGRLELAPLRAWLGPAEGLLAFEASVRAGLPTRCRDREGAEEALVCVLDALERARSMHELASARGERALAELVLAQTLEAVLVTPRRDAPRATARVARVEGRLEAPSTCTARRPRESVERLQALRAARR